MSWNEKTAYESGLILGREGAKEVNLHLLFTLMTPERIVKMLRPKAVAKYFTKAATEHLGDGADSAEHFDELREGYIVGFQKVMMGRLRPRM